MTFDGAKHFSRFAAVAIIGTLIAVPATGWWPLLSVVVALYFLLSLYNRFEHRDLSKEFRTRQNRQRENHR